MTNPELIKILEDLRFNLQRIDAIKYEPINIDGIEAAIDLVRERLQTLRELANLQY